MRSDGGAPPPGAMEDFCVITIRVDDGEDMGTEVVVEVVPFVLGREADCDLVVDDLRVSRHHAQVEVHDDGRVVLRDLGSANGTYVDERRIDGGVWFAVPGSFRIGRSTISVGSAQPLGGDGMVGIPVTPAPPVLQTDPTDAAGPRGVASGSEAAPRWMRPIRVVAALLGALSIIGAVAGIALLDQFGDDRLVIVANIITGAITGFGLIAMAVVLPRRELRVWQFSTAVCIFGAAQIALFFVIVLLQGDVTGPGLGFFFLVLVARWLRNERAWWGA